MTRLPCSEQRFRLHSPSVRACCPRIGCVGVAQDGNRRGYVVVEAEGADGRQGAGDDFVRRVHFVHGPAE